MLPHSKSAQLKITRNDGTFVEYSAYTEFNGIESKYWIFARTDEKEKFQPIKLREIDSLDFSVITDALEKSEPEFLNQ